MSFRSIQVVLRLYCTMNRTFLRWRLYSSTWLLYMFLKGGFLGFLFFTYYIQHCFICRHSDFTVSTDAGIELNMCLHDCMLLRNCSYCKVQGGINLSGVYLNLKWEPHEMDGVRDNFISQKIQSTLCPSKGLKQFDLSPVCLSGGCQQKFAICWTGHSSSTKCFTLLALSMDKLLLKDKPGLSGISHGGGGWAGPPSLPSVQYSLHTIG